MEYVTISSLSNYEYCPKQAWYLFVAREGGENAALVAGALFHERVDAGGMTTRGECAQERTVPLYSDRYGLIGIADVVEEGRGVWYPVEYKKGAAGDWRSHQVQLCAQSFCLEEMLALTKPIPRGFIFYGESGARQEVRLDKALRTATERTIAATRKLLTCTQPPVVAFSAKCPPCRLYPVCLPKEVAQLNKRQARWWR